MTHSDIQDRKDIKIIVDSFYTKVKLDDLIGYIFNDVAHIDWGSHLPVMYNFWENVIFYTGNYTGNPMVKHQILHQQSPMTTDHFKRWIHLFEETVDEHYIGENANLLKEKAKSIAMIMQIKLLGSS